MPALDHYRLTFSGTIGPPGVPLEIWSHGLSFAVGNQPFLLNNDLKSIADACKGVWQTTVAPLVSVGLYLTKTRVAYIAGGLVLKNGSGEYCQADNLQEVPAAGAASEFPPQVALAVSTLSPAAGPTGRGRFYLPVPAVGPLASFRVQDAAMARFTNSMHDFVVLTGDAFAAKGAGRAVVASAGSIKRAIPPANRLITSVRVGNVLDTIRSRRSALNEVYATRPVP